MMAIGAVLVVATGNDIEGLTVDLHAKALFMMLPEAKRVQYVAHESVLDRRVRLSAVGCRPGPN